MKRYYIFPLIYVLIVVALMTNYSLGRRRVMFTSGNLEARFVPTRSQIKKTQYLLPEEEQFAVSSAQISFRNITFYFSDKPKNENNLVLTSVTIANAENIILSFERNITISFQSHKLFKEELIISMRSPDFFRYSIPLSFAIGHTLAPKSSTLLSTSFGDNTFYLNSTKQFVVTKRGLRHYLEVFTDTISLRYAKGSTTDFVFLEDIPTASPLSRSQYTQVLASYLDKAYEGWLFGRYSVSEGRWLMPEGIFSFSDDIVMCLFSELILRDDTDKYYAQLTRAISKNSTGKNPHLDIIRGYNRPALEYVEYSSAEEQFIRAKIILGDTSVFTQHDIFARLYASSLDELKIKMIQWLGTFSLQELSTLEAISLLYYGSQAKEWKEVQEFIEQNRSYLVLRAFQQLTTVDVGYFVVNGTSIDTKATILLGKYLISSKQESNIVNFGYKMLVNILNLSNTLAYIPRFYVVKSHELLPRGIIPPEELYFLLQKPAVRTRLVKLEIPSTNTLSHNENRLTTIQTLSVLSYMNTTADLLVSKNTNNEIVIRFTPPLRLQLPFYAYIWPFSSPSSVEAFGEIQGLSLPVESTQQGLYHSSEDILIYKTQAREPLEVLRIRY